MTSLQSEGGITHKHSRLSAYRALTQALAPVCAEDAAYEARLLLEHVGKCKLHHWDSLELSPAQEQELQALLVRRKAGEPLQYLLGEWEFYGLPMRVTSDVLIPRQDSETLVERGIRAVQAGGRILDLCCGSGCIGIAVAKRVENCTLTLSDISEEALAIAKENAAQNAVTAQMVQSDLFANIGGSFDLILCNPPYLSAADMAAMQRELSFEPAQALYGGVDGMDFYRRIATEYRVHLAPGGTLLLEIGSQQADALAALFPGAELFRDFGGNARVLRCR